MGLKLQTIREIREKIREDLRGIYPISEINALTALIFRTIDKDLRLHQLYDPQYIITPEKQKAVLAITYELRSGKPIQYILGHTFFLDCKIKVSPAVLIPRQETEELTALILKENRNYKGTVTDIGTGSGCIAIALAKNLPDAEVIATDISEEAISLAKENAENENVKIRFLKDDILNPLTIKDIRTGIIVSNPPYVRNSEKDMMHQNVLSHEPHGALFVDDDHPLIFYEAITDVADTILERGGRIYFEINEAMGSEISSLLASQGYEDISLIKDLNGKDRIVRANRK